MPCTCLVSSSGVAILGALRQAQGQAPVATPGQTGDGPPVAGELAMPTGPGLGLKFNDAAITRFGVA